MATTLSSSDGLPVTAVEVVGTTYVTLTVGAQITRVDVYFSINAGFFSYEAGAPTIDSPVPADTWFVLWERPVGSSDEDSTVQVKTDTAGTSVYFRAV